MASMVPFVLQGSRSSVTGAFGSAPVSVIVAVVPEGPRLGLTVKIGPEGAVVAVGWGVDVAAPPVISNVAEAVCSLAAPIVATTLELSPTRPLKVKA